MLTTALYYVSSRLLTVGLSCNVRVQYSIVSRFYHSMHNCDSRIYSRFFSTKQCSTEQYKDRVNSWLFR